MRSFRQGGEEAVNALGEAALDLVATGAVAILALLERVVDVAFLARQNPLAVIPVAILLGGIEASGGLIQRWHDLPDATVLVVRGIIFLVILASEPLYGRFRIFQQRTA